MFQKKISKISQNLQISKAFTLIEMMIVVVILGIGLLGVIATLSNSYKFLYDTKNKVSAINIARAGMESVFNMRNTNWQRWGGKKDQCWLKVNPLYDGGNGKCEDDTWFGTGSFVISLTGTDQKYFTLTEKTTPLALTGNLVANDWNFLVCKNSDNILSNCGNISSKPANYFDTILYFQQIRGGYLLDKQANNTITCADGTTTLSPGTCGDGRALEKNFCVDVVYFDGDKFKVSYCSVLTNFKYDKSE